MFVVLVSLPVLLPLFFFLFLVLSFLDFCYNLGKKTFQCLFDTFIITENVDSTNFNM